MFGLTDSFERQRSRLFLWAPVFLACGIGLYFADHSEPSGRALILCLLAGLAVLPLLVLRMAWLRFLVAAVVLGLAGFGLAAFRSHTVAAPVLNGDYWGGVEGRIVGLDRSASDAPRVLLDHLNFYGLPPEQVPERARIALQGWIAPGILTAGNRIVVTARMAAPSPPVEPGGFDFRRNAWFSRIGAIGYSRDPALLAEPRQHLSPSLWLFDLRQHLTSGIMAALPGRDGAFATAITTGDMAELDADTLASLRASSLAHLYSISGLHMSLVSAFVFALIRSGLALVPPLALRVRAKKVAAVVALVAAFFYLLLSGSNVATQRSFIMIAVVLGAVLIDRPAVSLRSLALSALIILALFPESLTEAGFQMSYAATIALVTGFGALNRQQFWQDFRRSRYGFLSHAVILVVTSLLAGVATAPFSAFHFNRITQFGMLANVLAVPVMGLLVMPAASIAALAAPFGLAQLPLTVMGWGIGWILAISDWVAGMGGAVRMVPAGPMATLPLLALGAMVLLLWQGRGRRAGLVLVLIGFGLWAGYPRPQILIAGDGQLIGVMTDAGRALSLSRGNGFAAESWLQNDGDGADQKTAFARAGLLDGGGGMVTSDGPSLLYLRKAEEVDLSACLAYTIIVAPQVHGTVSGTCLLIGADHLAANGATAISLGSGGTLHWEGARTGRGERPWTDPPGFSDRKKPDAAPLATAALLQAAGSG